MASKVIRDIDNNILEYKARIRSIEESLKVQKDEEKRAKLIKSWFECRCSVDKLLEMRKVYTQIW